MGSVDVKRTIAIVDFAHSGTTMVAGILEILGVPMVGKRYKAEKWEDQEIVEALQNEAMFAELVAQRNAQHDVWGFKYPGAWKFAPLLKRYLRNPVYFAIYKDSVSVTWRRFGTFSLTKLANTVQQLIKSVEGIQATGLPVHMLSYQKAVTDQLHFVTLLAQMVGLEPSLEQTERAADYIQPNTHGPRGHYPSVEEALQDG